MNNSGVQEAATVRLHACSCQSIYEQFTHGQPVLKHQRFSKQPWPGEIFVRKYKSKVLMIAYSV